MEENKRELNLEEMDKVSGGTPADGLAYFETLMEKYGVQKPIEVLPKATKKEIQKFRELCRQ